MSTTPPPPRFASPTKSLSEMSFMSTDGAAGIILPPMEPGLAKMDRILVKAKIIPHTTVAEACQVFWSDNDNDDESESFYEKWLRLRENTDITIGPWEECTESYRDETFDKKRTVTFKSPRTLSSVTSPTNNSSDPSKLLVNVQEIQHLKMEQDDGGDNDRVIVATQVKQTNVPFGESFVVHWRWVATNVKPKKIVIRVAFAMEMLTASAEKHSNNIAFAADKLRKQQGNFSAQRHSHLFRTMKEEIASRQVVLSMKDPTYGLVKALGVFFPFWAPKKQIDTVPRMVGKVLEQLRLIELLPVPATTTTTSTTTGGNKVKAALKQLKSARDTVKVLVERERAWVIGTIPDAELASDMGFHEDMPGFLVPAAKALEKIQTLNPYDRRNVLSLENDSNHNIDYSAYPYVDGTLQNMTVVASKTIFDCSTEDVMKFMTTCNTAWYESWLTDAGRRSEVDVPAWTANEKEPTKDEFSGEMFSHSRTVTCRFDKSIYNKAVDPSSAAVKATQKQLQLCRFDADGSVFIWTMTTTVEGNAFADSWKAHVRWVVSPMEDSAVQVKIGYAIDILKPVMIETQLRSTALTEVKERQIKLLTTFRENLRNEIEAQKRKHPVVETVESSVSGAVNQVQRWVRMYPENMLRDDPAWQPIFLGIRNKLNLLQQILRYTGSKASRETVQEEARHVFIELENVETILKGIMETMGQPDDSDHTLDEDITTKFVL